ncbi:MAG TPA: putative collagen-binding domain-containing protein [Candidatus Brocadiia bacterium]|nr:putative collagen-binding domain-containing protein [Candidatus Brocadiia bacterium]
MKFIHPLSMLVMTVSACSAIAGDAEQGIQPWAKNPWYWSYRSEPVLLLGGSDDDNLFQWLENDLIAQLDRLTGAGGNVIRNTMSDRKDKGFEIYPFKQLENGKYDLNRWNDEYWTRFERMLRETAKRQIFIQIEVWDRFDYTDSGGNRWQIHPYNPKNNINYTSEQSGLAERYPDHPGANKQPFFFTTPGQRNNTILLQYQQRFVEKMLECSLQYDHVLYCMDNETSAEPAWGEYWAKFIRERAMKKGARVYLTEMWDDWNLTAEQHKRTFDHPELYDFADVSQNNHNKGQKHWDNFIFVRQYLSKNPRPMNTTKTYGADKNKFGDTSQDGIERFWRHLLAGAASMRFHRPDSGLGLNDAAVAAIRAARKLESKIPLWTVSPHNELLSDREDNEAYLAADPGRAYALYFPNGGQVRLDASAARGTLAACWIDIASGEWGPTQELQGGGWVSLTAPGKGNWSVAIVAGK